MATDTKKQFTEHLYEAAGRGDINRIESLIKVSDVINGQNEHGWTALMFAARNGKAEAVQCLLSNGCDATIMTSSGQTALDIAKFWNHINVIRIFEDHPTTAVSNNQNVVNFFGHSPVNRFAHKRNDTDWIESKMKDKSSQFLLFSDGFPWVEMNAEGKPKLCRHSYNDISFLFETDGSDVVVVFLGLIKDGGSDPSDKFSRQEEAGSTQAWFAVDVTTAVSKEKLEDLRPGSYVLSGAGGMQLLQLSDSEGAIAAQGRSMLDWHSRYKYCPTCGNTTVLKDAGYKRECEKKDCISNKAVKNTSYPRLDPVVIMLIVSPNGDKCLLGRQTFWPQGMYSCLAGFMEPGETMEDAVRREVAEESGILVGRVMYHSNQPWPRPSTLMLGCIGFAISEEINIDKEELEDAKWFTRQQVVELISGQGGFVPIQKAIAHQLIKAWLGMSSSL
ncbi:NAD-capped RNA hydrolase NUDT12-like [Ptychodera flava]|uniref:NAD-capped RNA hydrolase NUDT12-like n=1 Tax=Ptychodera flava TaxID=63121 RepID=UPI00396AA8BF